MLVSFFVLSFVFHVVLGSECVNNRPEYSMRSYYVPVIEEVIKEIKADIKDHNLACLFENTFPNTLDTTVKFVRRANETKDGFDDAFIITGDIKAMWLRDSANQVLPYIKYLKREDYFGQLHVMFRGIINRQAKQILLDPWANAFSYEGDFGNCPISPHISDHSEYKACVFERKFEIDSLAAFLKLSRSYFQETNDLKVFNSNWLATVKVIFEVLKSQQASTQDDCVADKQNVFTCGGNGGYTFQRNTKEPTDSLEHGMGSPGQYCGMIRSHFRPSDDSCTFPFLVPANAMLTVELKHVSKIVFNLDENFSIALEKLAFEIEVGLNSNAIFNKRIGKELREVFVYEADGFGNGIFMDDANVPSLLSLPYLGFINTKNYDIYKNTRRYILNDKTNPYFEKGKYQGIGGSHIGPNFIWPMSLTMQALTSTDVDEIKTCLKVLIDSASETWFMHESFHKNDITHFTRAWFAWANSLFGELILQLHENNKQILNDYY